MMKKSLLLGLCVVAVFLQTAIAQTINYLPSIPYFDTNPYKVSMWKGLQLSNPAITLDFGDADELQLAALAYMHPKSPYFMDASTFNRLMALLDTTLTDWNNGKRLADITNCFQGCFAYAMMKSLYPQLIPVGKKNIWESGIRKQIDSCFNSGRALFLQHYVRDVWLNGHQRFALAMFFGGEALGDSVMKEYGRYATEEVFTQCLLPNGATHYLGYHNEGTTYHPVVVKFLVDYWLATQSTKVYRMLEGLVNYVPLNQHPYKTSKGYCEYTTGPSNKCYYNGLNQDYAAAISAYISSDGYNWSYGKNVVALELGFLYKPGIVAATLPDNFMLYDADCLGPRGRYGNWGLMSTTRDPSSALPEHPQEASLPYSTAYEGKNTFVGAYILDTLAANWKNNYPLNAAFHAAGVGVKMRTGKETEWGRGFRHSWLTVNEKNAVTKSFQIYGISTRYSLNQAGGRMKTIPWEGMQQWVLTPDRLVGMMEIQANQQQKVYGLKARMLLVSGRKGVSGTKKVVQIVNRNTFKYGMLQAKIHDENFKGLIDTQYVNIIPFTTNDDFSAEIELHDAKDSANDKIITYSAGTKRFALVEITKSSNSFSTATVYPIADTALQAFQFVEQNGRKIRMVHNISSKAVTYTDTIVCPFNQLRLLQSWNDSAVVLPSINAQGIATITSIVPANSHIVLVNTASSSDFSQPYQTFPSVFKSNIPLPVYSANFYAHQQKQQIRLHWQLIASVDNTTIKTFRIDKWVQNGQYLPVFQCAYLRSLNAYAVTDSFPNLGVNRYRLIAILNTGEERLLANTTMHFVSSGPKFFSLFPNPAPQHSFVVQYAQMLPVGTQVRVIKADGTMILNKQIQEKTMRVPIQLPAYTTKGTYWVSVQIPNTAAMVQPLQIP
jgi:hypothetical protein